MRLEKYKQACFQNELKLANNQYLYYSKIDKNNGFKRSRYFGGDNWTRTSDPLHVKQVL